MRSVKLLAFLLFSPAIALAAGLASPVWDYPTTAAELAWGNAVLSLEYAPRGMSVNPALLHQIKWREFCGSGILWLQETSGGSLNGVLPLGRWGASAMALSYWDYGRIERYSETGIPQGAFNPYASSASLSYGINIYQNFSVGLNLKGSLQSLEKDKEYQLGADLAVAYRFKFALANLMLRNWGPQYPLADTLKFDLPLTIIAGANTSLLNYRLKVALQLNGPRDSDWYPTAAVAVTPWPGIDIRIGYDGRSGLKNTSRIGIGFSINQTSQQDYSLEYGYRSFDSLDKVHAISLSMSF